MKTSWNDRQGRRDRRAWCVLVTADGNVHHFAGSALPGVCHATETAYEKAGKWSNSTWEIIHADTTACIQWMEDWDTGRVFPQASWDAAYFWLAGQAPLLTRDGFERFIRSACPRHAERWDATREAEQEYGFAATAEEIAAMQAAQERIGAEKAAYEAEQAARRANSPFAYLLLCKVRRAE